MCALLFTVLLCHSPSFLDLLVRELRNLGCFLLLCLSLGLLGGGGLLLVLLLFLLLRLLLGVLLGLRLRRLLGRFLRRLNRLLRDLLRLGLSLLGGGRLLLGLRGLGDLRLLRLLCLLLGLLLRVLLVVSMLLLGLLLLRVLTERRVPWAHPPYACRRGT